MRLLIVEDEKKLCDTIAKTLYQAGYEVDTCYDGDEALDYILAEKNSERKTKKQRFSFYLQEARSWIRLKA